MTEYQVLVLKIEEKAETLKNSLHMGQAKDHEEYKYMVGQLRGLMVAVNIVKDLEATSMESDDD